MGLVHNEHLKSSSTLKNACTVTFHQPSTSCSITLLSQSMTLAKHYVHTVQRQGRETCQPANRSCRKRSLFSDDHGGIMLVLLHQLMHGRYMGLIPINILNWALSSISAINIQLKDLL